eukprot:TRINITY_DN46770_c0_g1_i1.p1 TRINITY_DN46770_c0_g1~~TRINITY_DN46770_c0_g1_i1.p1  ORF type:complete len:140 (+),score=31.78 TRINITY_DN46770_c0_g1_i1:66-422(+)
MAGRPYWCWAVVSCALLVWSVRGAIEWDGVLTCSRYIARNTQYCGCYYNNATDSDSGWVDLPMDVPFRTLILRQWDYKIAQGCCALTHKTGQPLHTATGWGACEDFRFDRSFLDSEGW